MSTLTSPGVLNPAVTRAHSWIRNGFDQRPPPCIWIARSKRRSRMPAKNSRSSGESCGASGLSSTPLLGGTAITPSKGAGRSRKSCTRQGAASHAMCASGEARRNASKAGSAEARSPMPFARSSAIFPTSGSGCTAPHLLCRGLQVQQSGCSFHHTPGWYATKAQVVTLRANRLEAVPAGNVAVEHLCRNTPGRVLWVGEGVEAYHWRTGTRCNVRRTRVVGNQQRCPLQQGRQLVQVEFASQVDAQPARTLLHDLRNLAFTLAA